jgi:hypothetical protein
MHSYRQPWIHSSRFDLLFIISPGISSSILVLCIYNFYENIAEIPLWLWVLCIVCIDVGHVYSTLFRTYFQREEFLKRKAIFILLPILCWVIGYMLYSLKSIYFWRTLAYIAVFHFVRQQYGFFMLYGRSEAVYSKLYKCIDKTAIYGVTLFPLLYWHTHERHFSWFIEQDFLQITSQWVYYSALAMYVLILAGYCCKEIFISFKYRTVNIPKNLFFTSTLLSWSIGIILLDNDIAFTATNVISHGIPYMALIWIYGKNTSVLKPHVYNAPIKKLFSFKYLGLFILLLCVVGFVEEGLWDSLVWNERKSVFNIFHVFPQIHSEWLLAFIVPTLALPQFVHYLLDAFIWRVRNDEALKEILFLYNR